MADWDARLLPLTHLAGVGSQFSEAVASLDRIRELRALATEEAETAGMAAVPSLRGDVESWHPIGTLPEAADQHGAADGGNEVAPKTVSYYKHIY